MTDDSRAAANRKARDEKKQAHWRQMMDRYTERFRAAAKMGTDTISPGSDAPPAQLTGNCVRPQVAREVHAAIELVLERDRTKSPATGDIQCRKGCSHCCHGPVEIWPQEAALLLEAARAAGVELNKARLERQSRYTADTWRQQPATDRACGFLGEDGACTVYESRPNACRKLLVVTDPALCDAAQHPSESVGRWMSWEAEILESAALETFGAGLMPRLLLAELGLLSRSHPREGGDPGAL